MDRISTATKAVDLFGAGKHGFKDGNLGGGISPTDLNAEWFNGAQEELVSLLENVGLAPAAADRTQVRQAIEILIRRQTGSAVVAGGTADALTGDFTPDVTALTHGMRFTVRAAAANATSTPTFKADGTAVKTIVRPGSLPLQVGDISGAGHWLDLLYDATLDKYVLRNPAGQRQLQPVTATVAANALTVTINPTTLDFRSSVLTSGAVSSRTLAAAASLVVPNGATLGTVNGIAARLAILALDNAGTIEPAIANLAGGVNLDECGVISTSGISAAANSAAGVYSAAARASVPYRVVGFLDITQAVAGVWATAPTLVQAEGGNALAALQSLGYSQTWQNFVRALGTTYYNTTGRPIVVSAVATVAQGGVYPALSVNGFITCGSSGYTAGAAVAVSAVVPPGASYALSGNGGSLSTLLFWNELR